MKLAGWSCGLGAVVSVVLLLVWAPATPAKHDPTHSFSGNWKMVFPDKPTQGPMSLRGLTAQAAKNGLTGRGYRYGAWLTANCAAETQWYVGTAERGRDKGPIVACTNRSGGEIWAIFKSLYKDNSGAFVEVGINWVAGASAVANSHNLPSGPVASWNIYFVGHFPQDGSKPEASCTPPRRPSSVSTTSARAMTPSSIGDTAEEGTLHREARATQARGGRERVTESACSFTWSMVDRFGEDADKDGLIDYPTAATNVPLTVEFDLVDETLCRQVVMTTPKAPGDFRWKVDGKPVPAVLVPDRKCVFRYDFPKEGTFKVEVASLSSSGSGEVVVQDWLIAGLGDSMASGEGNPDVKKSRAAAAKWQFERCHRSANSYQARTARDIEDKDSKTSVSFVHLACSGAGISKGVTGPYFGIVDGGADLPLPQQARELRDWVRSGEVDAVLLTIGVNEFEFGNVIAFCAKWDECPETEYKNGNTLNQFALDRIGELKNLYAQLAAQLAFVPKDRIYITEYPDLFTGADKEICADILNAKIDSIDKAESQWLVDHMLRPLNLAIRLAAKVHGWRVVQGAESGFKGHGYCTPGVERWIVTLTESRQRQDDNNGTVHPNERGHEEIAKLVLKVLRPDLYPADKPRPPAP